MTRLFVLLDKLDPITQVLVAPRALDDERKIVPSLLAEPFWSCKVGFQVLLTIATTIIIIMMVIIIIMMMRMMIMIIIIIILMMLILC